LTQGVIASFGDQRTGDIFHGTNSRAAREIPKELWRKARIKLDAIDAMNDLNDLRVPPGNNLEKLRGDLAGRHSIRVNNQFRIVFRVDGATAHEVQIVDYH
jgi:proteic killer suppression protein